MKITFTSCIVLIQPKKKEKKSFNGSFRVALDFFFKILTLTLHFLLKRFLFFISSKKVTNFQED